MKKEDVASLIIYFLMILGAIIVGLSAISPTIEKVNPQMNPLLLVVIILCLGVFINIVMLEILHAIGAKIGGYKVISINIIGLCFEKIDGKFSLRIRDFDGLTGETRICPAKEKVNLKPFVWMPLFGYAIEVASCIVLYSYTTGVEAPKNSAWLAIGSIVWILVSSMIALYNLVPLKLDTTTDGYRMVLIANPVNREAYNDLLVLEEDARIGKQLKGLKVYNEITQFTADLNLVAAYECINSGEYKRAEEILDLGIPEEKKIEFFTYNRMISQKIYSQLMQENYEGAKDTYEKLGTSEFRRFVASDISMETIRAYTLIAGLLDESNSEVLYCKTRMIKARKYALKSRLEAENRLFEESLNIVYKNHPDWKEKEGN